MASSLKNLSDHNAAAIPNASNMRFGIVCSAYHEDITGALLQGCTDTLEKYGANTNNIHLEFIPGAYEMPAAAHAIAKMHPQLDAIIAIGCVIKGDTEHDVYINHSVAQGLQRLNTVHNKPFIFGLLTPNTHQQALDRAGGKHGNKGVELAVAAIQMSAMYQKISDK